MIIIAQNLNIYDLFKIINCANYLSQDAAKFRTTPPLPPSLKFLVPKLWSTIKPATTVAHCIKYTCTKRTLSCLQTGGGEVSPRKSVLQSACQYEVTSRVSNFQNGVLSEATKEADKNFGFITEILFLFLGFGDFKVSIVIEN